TRLPSGEISASWLANASRMARAWTASSASRAASEPAGTSGATRAGAEAAAAGAGAGAGAAGGGGTRAAEPPHAAPARMRARALVRMAGKLARRELRYPSRRELGDRHPRPGPTRAVDRQR